MTFHPHIFDLFVKYKNSMLNSVHLVIYVYSMMFLQLFVISFAVVSLAESNEIIQVPANSARNSLNPSTHYYFRYQTPSHFNVTPSSIYITVPGLRTVFNIAQPTVVEITYQGSCEIHQGRGVHIKLLVDNHLIIGNTRTPNVADRHLRTNLTVGQTAMQFDQWLSQHHLPFELATLPIIQTAVVLVGPGLHIFDLGVHHSDIGLKSVIFGGTMRFKWTVVDNPNQVQGLSMWEKTSTL